MSRSEPFSLTRSRGRFFSSETLGIGMFLSCAILVIGVLATIYVFVGAQAWQTFAQTTHQRGPVSFFDFFLTTPWDANTQLGTLIYTIGSIALILATLLLAVPLSIGAAIFISEYSPGWLRAPLRGIIELFLGIPSVIFGLIGLIVVVPRVRDLLNYFAGGKVYNGFGIIPAAIVVTFMILPTISTISVDALQAVPRDLREGSLALGATRWQTIARTLVPAALPGITTGVILGIARALGETVAVAFVVGGAQHLPFALQPNNPYMPIYIGPTSVLTVLLLFNFKEASPGSSLYNALWTASFTLLLFSALLVGISRTLAARRIYQ